MKALLLALALFIAAPGHALFYDGVDMTVQEWQRAADQDSRISDLEDQVKQMQDMQLLNNMNMVPIINTQPIQPVYNNPYDLQLH